MQGPTGQSRAAFVSRASLSSSHEGLPEKLSDFSRLDMDRLWKMEKTGNSKNRMESAHILPFGDLVKKWMKEKGYEVTDRGRQKAIAKVFNGKENLRLKTIQGNRYQKSHPYSKYTNDRYKDDKILQSVRDPSKILSKSLAGRAKAQYKVAMNAKKEDPIFGKFGKDIGNVWTINPETGRRIKVKTLVAREERAKRANVKSRNGPAVKRGTSRTNTKTSLGGSRFKKEMQSSVRKGPGPAASTVRSRMLRGSGYQRSAPPRVSSRSQGSGNRVSSSRSSSRALQGVGYQRSVPSSRLSSHSYRTPSRMLHGGGGGGHSSPQSHRGIFAGGGHTFGGSFGGGFGGGRMGGGFYGGYGGGGGGGRFYGGGQFVPGGGRAPKGGGYF